MPKGLSLSFGLLVLIVILMAYWLSPPSIGKSTVILVVGEFRDQRGLSTPAGDLFTAIELARTRRNPPYAAEIVKVPVPDYWDRRASSTSSDTMPNEAIRRLLINEIVGQDVAAIICANTSLAARDVVNLGDAFRIPVILSIATNDRLLTDYPRGRIIRMVPKDSLQAVAIAEWCDSRPPGKIHIIYDDSAYGRDLYDSLTTTLRKHSTIGTPLRSPGNTVVEALHTCRNVPLSAIVFIGYPDQAADFLQWRDSLGIDTPSLLSDGCLGGWSKNSGIPTKNTVICFPSITRTKDHPSDAASSTMPTSPSTAQSIGYGEFAVHALDIIDGCIQTALARNLSKQQLYPMMLRALGGQDDDIPSTANSGTGDTRENSNARFEIFALDAVNHD